MAHPFRSTLLSAAIVGLTAMANPAVASSDYPNQPIRLIVPFAPGGSTDIVARIVGQRMGQELGQTVIVENKGGAGGAIGAAEAARAKPDGYTLSVATVSTMAVNPACRSDLPYDPVKDFIPVTNFANVPNVIVVNPKFPAENLEEMVKELKVDPGKYSYGSSGTCSINHLFGESFKHATGTDIVHVPYKGSGPAVVDTVAGQVEILFDNLPSSMNQISAGNLRAIAVAGPQRADVLKDTPTLAELGYPQLNHPAWYGLLAPAGTPTEIVNKLRDAAVVALNDPKVAQTLKQQGAAPSGNTPEEFAAEIRTWFDHAAKVVAEPGFKMD